MTLCSLQSVDLTGHAIIILGSYFTYNMELINQNNYCQAITNIHVILKLWRMRNLSTTSKILIFKALSISKLVYLALLIVFSNHITEKVAKIQSFYMTRFIPDN